MNAREYIVATGTPVVSTDSAEHISLDYGILWAVIRVAKERLEAILRVVPKRKHALSACKVLKSSERRVSDVSVVVRHLNCRHQLRE